MEATVFSPAAGHRDGGRLESVQILRGIAAMLVVFNHAGLLALSIKSQFGPSWLVPSKAAAEMGAIGVDLFFVISGFVMALSSRRFLGPWGASTFLALRFVRIAPLYYLASLFMLANLVRVGMPLDPSSLLNSITFIPVFDDASYSWPVHYLGWTLSFECVFYALVGTLIAGGAGPRPLRLLAATVAVPLVGLLIPAESAAWRVVTNPILWEFALGVTAYILWERCLMRRLRVPFTIVALGAFLTLLVALWLGKEWLAAAGWTGASSGGAGTVAGTNSPYRVMYWGLPAFLFFCAVIGSPTKGTGSWAHFLKLLGDASYSIYLWHLFVIILMKALAERVALHPDLVLVTSLIASAVVGVLVHKLVEKPMLSWGQKRVKLWTLRYARDEA